MNTLKIESKIYPLWAVFPSLLIYTIFAIAPIGISLFLSFTNWNMSRLYEPEFNGIVNYIELIKDPIFLRAIFNTFVFAIMTTLLKIILGFLLALALVKNVLAKGLLRTIFYAPCVISITVVGVLFKSILANRGLLNNILDFLGIGIFAQDWLGSYVTALFSVVFVETWMWSGFNMFIFIAGLQAISKDYYESALIDGASAFKQLIHITVPLIMPALTVVSTLSMAGGLKVFDIIYVLTNGGPGFDTQVLTTYTYQSFSLGFLGESSAGSIILAVIVTLVSFLLNSYFKKKEIET